MRDTITVNGREIGPSTDLDVLLRRQLKWGTALGQLPDEGSKTAIYALFKAATDTSIEPRLVEAVTAMLTDPDLEVRTGAVDIVQQFPAMFDPVRLVEILDAHQAMFQPDAPTNARKPDLASGLLRAAAARPTSNRRVIDRLREAAVDRAIGGWVLAGVTSNDTDWVIEHAPEVVQDDPARARIVLSRLTDPALRERLVRGIPRESPQLRGLMSSAVAEEIKDPAERDRLAKLLN